MRFFLCVICRHMCQAYSVENTSVIFDPLMQSRPLTALHYHGNTISVKCKCNILNLARSHELTAPPDGLRLSWQHMPGLWVYYKFKHLMLNTFLFRPIILKISVIPLTAVGLNLANDSNQIRTEK